MAAIEVRLEEQLNEVDLLIKEGKYSEAMDVLEEMALLHPTFGKTYNHIGWMYETKLKNLTKAEEYYTKAIETSPAYLATYYNFAILLSTLRKYDALHELLQKALKQPGIDRATINNEYGIMFEQLEEYDNAVHYYKEGIRSSITKDFIERAKDAIDRCEMKKSLLA